MDIKIVELPANIVKGFTTEKELFGLMESKLKIDSVAEVDDELQIDATITNSINSLKICTFQGDFNEATEYLREAEGENSTSSASPFLRPAAPKLPSTFR